MTLFCIIEIAKGVELEYSHQNKSKQKYMEEKNRWCPNSLQFQFIYHTLNVIK